VLADHHLSYLGWVGGADHGAGPGVQPAVGGAVSLPMGHVIGTLAVLVYTLFGGMWSVA
jgi:SSS family solute:Na+ symporter